MKTQPSPYLCHIFVCSNVRDNKPENPGCGANGGGELKAVLKQEIKDRGWKGKVRVSTTGCMGLCGTGPNVLLHPQGIHYSAVTEGDLPAILATIGKPDDETHLLHLSGHPKSKKPQVERKNNGAPAN